MSPLGRVINLMICAGVAWIGSGCRGPESVLERQPAVPTTARAQALEWRDGAITRGPIESRQLALLFAGHEFAEGIEPILNCLARHRAAASFFVTGTFLDRPEFAPAIERIVAEGHYLGPHSDAHLLYCAWDDPERTLVTHEVFTADLERNLAKIRRFAGAHAAIPFFLPPYEHHNREIAAWTVELGLTLVNLTRGTRSAADYTLESDANFASSQTILESILRREEEDLHGLNGFLLLLHTGAGPGRGDKMHRRLDELLATLAARGYQFVTISELLGGAPR